MILSATMKLTSTKNMRSAENPNWGGGVYVSPDGLCLTNLSRCAVDNIAQREFKGGAA